MADHHTAKAFDVDLQDLARMVAEWAGLPKSRSPTRSVPCRSATAGSLENGCLAGSDHRYAPARDRGAFGARTIARRQPMAVDLREIVGALRVSNDLERIGDLAKNIAKRVIALGSEFHPHKVIRGVEHMADLVLTQLKDVLDAYARQDVTSQGARGVARRRGDRRRRRTTRCFANCSPT